MATRIYVGNLPYTTDDQQLVELFGVFGEVQEAAVVIDRETGRSKGFGFVQMADDTAAHNAIAGLNGTMVGNRTIRVNEAQPRTERSAGSRYGGGGYGGGGYGGGGGSRDRGGYRDQGGYRDNGGYRDQGGSRDQGGYRDNGGYRDQGGYRDNGGYRDQGGYRDSAGRGGYGDRSDRSDRGGSRGW